MTSRDEGIEDSLSDGLLNQLVSLYEARREDMKQRWNRDLPFEELLFDRWERARQLGFGENTSIYHNSYVYGEVQVGDNTWIGPFTLLDGSGGLQIGCFCSISAGVQIYTHDTVNWAVSGGKAPYERASVRIGNCCFIGSQTVIGKGITIGEHSIVGANSFVNRNIPPYSFAAGTPCQIIGNVKLSETGQVTILRCPSKSRNDQAAF